MSWAFDAPSGVYKDHGLSSKIREAAVADSQFAPFASPEQGFGKGKGASVTITQVLNLPLAARVGETDRLPSGRPAIQTVSTSVGEWGYKAELTELEENLTHFDLRNKVQRALKNQMRLTMDKMIADAMKTTLVKAIPTGAGTITWDTDGTPSTLATVNLDVGHLRAIHDYMHGTLKIPPFANGQYVGILTTKAARGIKNDPEYKDWLAPSTFEPFVTGQLPKVVENFTLIETNHYDALDNTIGSGDILGECVFFGDDGAFLATVEDPEIRVGLPDDLGRFREVGWVGTIEAGLVWRTAALARVIHVSSS
jgi:N4-gp56 family major capsid protein